MTVDFIHPDNPTANVAGNQHWGHATSKDLLYWTNQPIAIFTSSQSEGIFTGSAVIDANNTSGFFPNATNGVVAIYTLNTPTAQTQDIAYSHDNGYTFTKYASNPVLSANSTQFRDPKVFWYAPTSRWVMVVAFATDFVVAMYTSPNLISWTHASNLTYPGLVSLGAQAECPNLVPIPTLIDPSLPLSSSNTASTDTYLLVISVNPGAPLGGSISTYLPGTFNGTHFIPLTPYTTRLTDFCKDNYAAQFFDDISPPVSMSWASNWQYADSTPVDTTSNLTAFRSAFSLPRTHVLANISVAGYDLLTLPPDLSPLYTTSKPLAASTDLANASLTIDYGFQVPSRAITFTVNITNVPLNTTLATGSMNFTVLSSTSGESIRGGFFISPPNSGAFFLSRARTYGFDDTNPFFNKDFSVTSPVTGGSAAAGGAYGSTGQTGNWSMQVVVDRSLVEVYLDGGKKVGTMVYWTEGELDTLILGSKGVSAETGVGAEVWGLKSVWAGKEVGGRMGEL
ncbi:hypothetical protein MMC30_000118 [Trapelia coarctata]|nr:hypothetical protein [Trapelia coarctata]